MAKKKLEGDVFSLDGDLDYGFLDNNFGAEGDKTLKAKERGVIGNITRGALTGMKDTATSASFIKKTIEKAMPRTYGEIAEAVDEAATSMARLYDQEARELKPRLNSIASKFDQLVPEDSRALKKLTKKMVDLTGGDPNASMGSSAAAQEDQAVTTALGAIFQQNALNTKAANRQQYLRDAVDKHRYDGNQRVLRSMDRSLSILSQYTVSYTQGYQKKMLELTLRSYLSEQAHYNLTRQFYEQTRQQNEAIIRNTSLPEYSKITMADRIKGKAKDKLSGSLFGEGTLVKRGIGKLMQSGKEYLEGMRYSLENADMMLDQMVSAKESLDEMNKMLQEMGEPPLTKAQMAGATAGGMGMEKVRDFFADKLRKRTEKNKKLTEWLAKVAKVINNPGAAIENLRGSDAWQDKLTDYTSMKGKGVRFADFLLEHFTEGNPNRSFARGNKLGNLDEPTMGFDKKAHVSLVDVIPGYLARIQREITMLRTGKDTPLTMYDFQKSEFVSQGKMEQRLFDRLGKEASQSSAGYYVRNAAEDFTKDQNAGPEVQLEVNRFLVRLSRIPNFDYTTKNIQATNAYKQLTPQAKALVDKRLETIDSSEDKEALSYDLTKNIRKIRESMPSLNKSLHSMVDAGYGDLLAKRGLMSKDDEGEYKVNEEEFAKLLEENGLIRSDINVKENIRQVNPKQVLGVDWAGKPGQMLKKPSGGKWNPKQAWQGLKKTKLYDWLYKLGVGDRHPKTGPMAQDVRRNLGEDAAPNGKAIDLQSMNGAMMAAVQHLGDEVEKMTSEDSLRAIKLNTDKMLLLMQQGGGISGSLGLEGILGGAKEKAGQMADYVRKMFTDKTNPVNAAFSKLMAKAMALGQGALEFGQRAINDYLPAGWRQVKDWAGKAWDKATEKYGELKDLYLPGGTEPVIRATKLKAGEYYDAASGKVIKTYTDLMASKGDILDKAGNIVLSVKERAEGLVDKHGDKVKEVGMGIVGAVVGGGLLIADQAKKAWNTLREKGMPSLENAKNWFKDRMGNIGFGGIGSGFGGYGKESYGVLVDIRDILLGDADKVRERLRKADGEEHGEGGNTVGSSGLVDASGNPMASSAPAQAPLQGGAGGGAGAGGFALAGNLWRRGRDAVDSAKEKLPGWKDKFMNSRAGGLFRKAGDQVGKLKDTKAGGLFNKAKSSKLGGWLGKGLSRAKGIGGGLLGMGVSAIDALAGRNQSGGEQGEQQATSATDPNRAKEVAEGQVDWSAPKGKMYIPAGQRAKGDNDGDGYKDGSLEDRRHKQEELKQQRQKKSAEADLTVRYKSEKSFFDTLMGGLGSVFSLMTKGLGGIFNLAGGILGKIPGMGGVMGAAKAGMKGMGGIIKGVGKVGAPIVNAGGWLLKNGAKLGVRGLARYAAFGLTRALPFVGGALMSVAGSAIATIGGVLASPVVLGTAAVALAGYGIYKLYKYANRNNATDFDKIRLAQYGMGSPQFESYRHMVYTLEAYLQDGKIGYNGGSAYTIDRNIKAEEIAEIFGVDKDDEEMGNRVADWYKNRFKPFYLTHLSALFAVDNKAKLDEVDKLPPEKQVKYLSAISFDSGPYGETTSPFKAIDDLDSGKERTKNMIEALIARIQEKIPKKKGEKIEMPAKKPQEPEGTGKPDGDQAAEAKRRAEEQAKAYAAKNAQTAVSAAWGAEDGPKPNIPAQLEAPAAPPGAIPLAPGSPLEGHGGLQYLKLGKGVNITNMHPGTLKLLLGMAEEYGKMTGKSLQINDGWRSTEEQARLHASNPDKAAPPGRSMHEYGLAVDINSTDADDLEKLGLMKKYGFTRPVGGEPWHMEPAGIQRNLQLARTDAGQRDQMVDLSIFRGGGGYGTVSNATKYKRNQEMAMALLDVPSKAAETPMTPEDTMKATSVAMDGKAVGVNGGIGKGQGEAANDPKKITLASQQTARENSGVKDLPSPEELKQRQQANAATNATGAGAADGEKAPSDTGGGSPANGDMRDVITRAAKRAGEDPSLMLAYAAVESDMNPNAKGSGSASGLFQFTRATWNEQLARNGKKYGLATNASPFDPEAATLMAAEYTKENRKALSKVKPNMGVTDIYLTHFLGAGGARTLLNASPDAIAAELLPEAARSNRGIFFELNGRPRTVREVYDTLTKRLTEKSSKIGVQVQSTTLPSSNAPKTDGLGNDSPMSLSSSGKSALLLGSMGGQQDSQQRPSASRSDGGMIPASSAGGVFVSSAGNSSAAQQRRQQGEGFSQGSLSKIEISLDKSLEIGQSQLDVLKDIAAKLDPKALAALLAAAVSAKDSASNQDSVKEQDKRNMGRTTQAVQSSIDFRRQA